MHLCVFSTSEEEASSIMQREPLSEQDLPSDVNVEKAVLGAIILNNEVLNEAILFLGTLDFYLSSHRLIFGAMVRLGEAGIPIDPVTLPSLLNERNELERVGGFTYLASLIDGVPRTDNIEYYCRIIKYKARGRDVMTCPHSSASYNETISMLVCSALNCAGVLYPRLECGRCSL